MWFCIFLSGTLAYVQKKKGGGGGEAKNPPPTNGCTWLLLPVQNACTLVKFLQPLFGVKKKNKKPKNLSLVNLHPFKLLLKTLVFLISVLSSVTPVVLTPSTKRKLPADCSQGLSSKKRRSFKPNFAFELLPSSIFNSSLTPASGIVPSFFFFAA